MKVVVTTKKRGRLWHITVKRSDEEYGIMYTAMTDQEANFMLDMIADLLDIAGVEKIVFEGETPAPGSDISPIRAGATQ